MTQAPAAYEQAPRFLADMNFNRRIVSGLRRRLYTVDVVTVQDLGLQTTPDPELLMHARVLDRILLTHDVNTMPKHFEDFVASLAPDDFSPRVMLLAQTAPIGTAIEELFAIWSCTAHEEWRNRCTYLPL